MEFMTVFMGGSPHNVPAYYSLLAHVDMGLGGWYPQGGFGAVAKAVEKVAKAAGAKFRYSVEVERIETENGLARAVWAGGERIVADVVVSAGDYADTETRLLDPMSRAYSSRYWKRKQMSPSGLIVTVGVNRKLPGLEHHNLFFDTDWDGHFNEVFDTKVWSERPLFYLCVPSRTDPGVAPAGHENLYFLAPMAAGTRPNKEQLNVGARALIARVETAIGQKFADDIEVMTPYGPDYFEETFHAYKGNAFGLAHTLTQSATLRPRLRSRKVKNLYYAGQYTNPGTGVPMVLISGKIVARLVREAKV
jgi:phytoene desaturase